MTQSKLKLIFKIKKFFKFNFFCIIRKLNQFQITIE